MADETHDRVHDLLIVGAGPVGLALALALKDAGLDIVLADARAREAVTKDPRDLALAHGSRLTLQRLGVWDAIAATAIEHIHISQQGGFGRTLLDAARSCDGTGDGRRRRACRCLVLCGDLRLQCGALLGA